MKNEKLLPYISGLHVLPWVTDGAANFLDGFIFNIKQKYQRNPRIFEFGAGNSTLYFLSRGCLVTSIEHDKLWAEQVQGVANIFGYSSQLNLHRLDRPYHEAFKVDSKQSDLVFIDGRDRVACLEQVVRECSENAVLVLDNTERMDGKYSAYTKLLENYQCIHFEQPFVFGSPPTPPESMAGLNLNPMFPSNGLAAGNYRDRSGNVNKGRSITTVATHKFRSPLTTQGCELFTPVC